MGWIHLIALGAGMGIYAVGSILFRTFTGRRKASGRKPASEQKIRPRLKVVPHDAADRESIPGPSAGDVREVQTKPGGDTVATSRPVGAIAPQQPPEEALLETPPRERSTFEAKYEPEEQTKAGTSGNVLADSAGIPDTPPSAAKAKRKKQWFLVKSSSGQIRVCQAWEATPKTIAGPFSTRDEATRAKPTEETT